VIPEEFLTPHSSFLFFGIFFSLDPKKSLHRDSADFILRAIEVASRLLCLTRVS
jgi:hypothetical protein